MKPTDPRVRPVYIGEPTGRPAARYDVQTWGLGILSTDLEPAWHSESALYHHTEDEAIAKARRLQALGETVRVVRVAPETTAERDERYLLEQQRRNRAELHFTAWLVAGVLGGIAGLMALAFGIQAVA